MKGLSFLCLLMIWCLPFTHALALNFVACPAIVCAILLSVLGLGAHLSYSFVRKSDFFLFALWLLLSGSYFLGGQSSTAVNHWIAYTAFIVFGYFGVGRVTNSIVSVDIRFMEKIFKTISVMLVFTCFYGIVDWIFMVFTGMEIPIFRAEGGGVGNAVGYARARSFFGEPSGFSNFISVWAPVVLWYTFSRSKLVGGVSLSVILPAFFLTFSAKGFLAVAFFFPIVLLFFAFRRGFRPERILFILLLSAIFLAVVSFSGIGGIIVDAIAPKFFGSDIYDARAMRGLAVVDLIRGIHWLVGYGPASYETLLGVNAEGASFLSGYAYLLGDAGILGLCLFLVFSISQLLFLKKIKRKGLALALFIAFYIQVAGEVVGPAHYTLSFYLCVVLIHLCSRYDVFLSLPLRRINTNCHDQNENTSRY